MPIWLIEWAGAERLNAAFWFLAAMTAPVWALMLAWPRARITRVVADPLGAPAAYALILVYLIWRGAESAFAPAPPGGAAYADAKEAVRHPMVFLGFYCSLQIGHLAMGAVVCQRARARGWRAPAEIVLCWALGPIGLLAFAARRLLVGGGKRGKPRA